MRISKFLTGLVFLFSFLFFGTPAQATHIVGGEMTYVKLPNNSYAITMTIYRDCFYGVPPFDDPASIGVFDVNNELVSSFGVNVDPDSAYIPSIINNACAQTGSICYVKATYHFTVNLPIPNTIYYIVYQRCCRNQTILNIVNPEGTGATYSAEIRTNTFLPNSSPVFKGLPPLFICSSFPLVFDNSATDVNGDTLRYSLCTPLTGADTINPAPFPPFNPPYQPVTFSTPYSVTNMLDGTPGPGPLSIDSITGILTATPTTIGQFVIGVCVKEYRNNVYLGETRRDYQLNVLPCPQIIVAAFLNPITTCGSNTVTFQNGSFGAISYKWDFGVIGTNSDTSILQNPVYTYPDTGNYTVTLIATSPFDPSCKDTVTGVVHVRPQLQSDFTFTKDFCTNTFQFHDSIVPGTGIGASVAWNFGDASTSNVNDPSHVYGQDGIYNVTLISTSTDGCKDTVVKPVTAIPTIQATTNVLNNITCKGQCDGSGALRVLNPNGSFVIQWVNLPGQTNDTLNNLCPGTYTALVTDSLGCVTSSSLVITQPDSLIYSLVSTDAYCGGKCIGTATVNITGGTTPYSILWANSQTTSTISSLCPGFYTISVTDANNCPTPTDSVEVLYSDSIPPLAVSPDSVIIYKGESVNITSTVASNYTYTWNPATWLNDATVSNPVSTPDETIDYILTIADQNNCRNSDSVHIQVIQYICNEPEIYIPNAFTPNDDNTNDILEVRGGQIKELLLRVYDRWGEKVFEATQPRQGWDGTYKGKKVMPGVFVYYLNAVCYDNEKFFKKGNITVLK